MRLSRVATLGQSGRRLDEVVDDVISGARGLDAGVGHEVVFRRPADVVARSVTSDLATAEVGTLHAVRADLACGQRDGACLQRGGIKQNTQEVLIRVTSGGDVVAQ